MDECVEFEMSWLVAVKEFKKKNQFQYFRESIQSGVSWR